MLKRYELLDLIGTGGMGHVYRARISGPADASKFVAVKVMHPHLADDADFISMFHDEMRVAMALDHRNIVKTFDADHVDTSYFMVMELVEGCPLRQLLDNVARNGALIPLDLAVFIGMEISAALEFAHRPRESLERGGVLHRDISPSNILLASEGDVKLADFGIAKAAGASYVTSANIVRGKLQYMSPEQARGAATPQSDIYSLGAVLYEATTGVPVPQLTGFECSQSWALPASPKTLRGDIPDDLATLILQCLQPNTKTRISTAAELRNGLASVAFELQGHQSTYVDAHASLRRFLKNSTALQDRRLASTATKRETNGLAAVLLEQVQAVETDPGFKMATNVPMTPKEESSQGDCNADPIQTLATDEKTRPVAITTETTKLGHQTMTAWIAVVAVLLLIAFATVGVVLYASSDGPSTIDDTKLHADARHVRIWSASDLGTLDASAPDADALVPHDAFVPIMDSETQPEADDARLALPDARRIKKQRRKRKRTGYGILDINSIPWSRVYIDGRLRGETPLQRVRLRAGRHRIRLVNAKLKRTALFRLSIRAGQRISKVFKIPAN